MKTVAQRAGRAELGTDTLGTHESEIDVNMQALNGSQVAATQAGIRQVLTEFPGPTLTSNGFLTERIDETLSGYTAPVVVNVFGNDLDSMDQEAAQIGALLNQLPGAEQIQIQSPPGTPEIAVRLRKDDVARWGFDPRAGARRGAHRLRRRGGGPDLRREPRLRRCRRACLRQPSRAQPKSAHCRCAAPTETS